MTDLVMSLQSNIHHQAVKSFSHKKIEFIENESDAKLKKLTVKANKRELKDGLHPENGIFIELDHTDDKLSKFTHFIKSSMNNATKKVDFCFILKKDSNIYFVISDLKSSPQGNNERSDGQYKNTKLFMNYLADVFETFESSSSTSSKIFYKLLFIPNNGILGSEPIFPSQSDAEDFFKSDPDCNFHLVDIDEDGQAIVELKDIITRIPF